MTDLQYVVAKALGGPEARKLEHPFLTEIENLAKVAKSQTAENFGVAGKAVQRRGTGLSFRGGS